MKYATGLGLSATNVKLWTSDDASVTSEEARGGRSFTVKTGATYELELPAVDGYKWVFTPDSGIENGTTEGDIYSFTVKGAAVITITREADEDSTPDTELPTNALAAIEGSDGTGNSAAPSDATINVVWWEQDTARATLGKPSLDDAKAIIAAHLKELGYNFTTAAGASGNAGKTVYTLTKNGYPAGTVVFADSGSDVVEGYRYTNAATGYEVALKSADYKVVVTTDAYAKVTDADSNVTWSDKGDGSVKITIATNDDMTVEEFDGFYTLNGVKTGMNKTNASFPTIGSLAYSGTGTGFKRTTSGPAVTYEAYAATNTTLLAQGDILESGYVKLTDSSTYNLEVGGVAISGSGDPVKVGEKIDITALGSGKIVRVVDKDNNVVVTDVTGDGSTVVGFSIPAEKVTGDLTIAKVDARNLSFACKDASTDDDSVTAEWFLNGEKLTTLTGVKMSSADKLTIKLTFAKAVEAPEPNGGSTDPVGAKLAVTNGTAVWNISLGDASQSGQTVTFNTDKAFDVGDTIEGTIVPSGDVSVIFTLPVDGT